MADDDELLEKAIPIDQVGQDSGDELLKDAIPIEEVETNTTKVDEPEAIDLAESEGKRQIRTLGQGQRHEDEWNRTPNTTGQGAIHAKTFVSKLRVDAIEHMDQLINEWLDAHPQYEVKLVSTSVGDLTGKTKEPAMFVTVWV